VIGGVWPALTTVALGTVAGALSTDPDGWVILAPWTR
jgi:hypothetical protein